MSWPEKDVIAPGVVNMLRGNMGLKPGERLLVMSDLPRPADWQEMDPELLEEMLERALLGRLVADIARAGFPQSPVSFLPFAATGSSGREPDAETAARMREAEVVIAITSYSLSHTTARARATDGGVRLASMPGFEAAMLAPDGPMAADTQTIAAACRTLVYLLTRAGEVQVRTPYGTDLRFSIAGRPGQGDDGIYDGSAAELWGNLPAGETFAVPVEGTGEGQLVVPAGWCPGLAEPLTFRFERGAVVASAGGGKVGDHFRDLLALGSADPVAVARRNLAELGIGCNPNARRPDNPLEAEKIKGTVHIAVGDNVHMGGQVESDLHYDFVQPEPDLWLDGQQVIARGQWLFGA